MAREGKGSEFPVSEQKKPARSQERSGFLVRFRLENHQLARGRAAECRGIILPIPFWFAGERPD